MHHHFFPGEGEFKNFGVGPLGKFWDFIFQTHFTPVSK
jgi:sterol desaturase/sphingolipid hydroxylase (fatty acid hydroxylase superfamily)